jgi:hypothetical protein
MICIPDIQKKTRKPSYHKPEAVRELERLADADARRKHPSVDPKYLAPRLFRDDKSNSLTEAIVAYITLRGGFASRINSTGIFRPKLGKFTPTPQKNGIGDVIGTYQGKSLMVEVKIGRDKMSDRQERVRAEHERSGGLWFTAKDFTSFKQWFDALK